MCVCCLGVMCIIHCLTDGVYGWKHKIGKFNNSDKHACILMIVSYFSKYLGLLVKYCLVLNSIK